MQSAFSVTIVECFWPSSGLIEDVFVGLNVVLP